MAGNIPFSSTYSVDSASVPSLSSFSTTFCILELYICNADIDTIVSNYISKCHPMCIFVKGTGPNYNSLYNRTVYVKAYYDIYLLKIFLDKISVMYKIAKCYGSRLIMNCAEFHIDSDEFVQFLMLCKQANVRFRRFAAPLQVNFELCHISDMLSIVKWLVKGEGQFLAGSIKFFAMDDESTIRTERSLEELNETQVLEEVDMQAKITNYCKYLACLFKI